MVYHDLLIYSSTDGYLSCFHLLVVMNNAAINIHIQVSVWTYAFTSLGYIPKIRIA